MLASSAITRSLIDRGCRALEGELPRCASDRAGLRAACRQRRRCGNSPTTRGALASSTARGCAGSQARTGAKARPCHGREEIVRFFTALFPAWENYRYVIKDANAIGDDRGLVHGRDTSRGTRERRGAGRRRLPLLLAPAWTIHPGGGSHDREWCASRSRTQRRDPRSRRAVGVGDAAGERRRFPFVVGSTSAQQATCSWRSSIPISSGICRLFAAGLSSRPITE